MKLRLPVLAVSAALIGSALAPLSASAHDSTAELWAYDRRVGYGGVNQDHQRAYSCDTVGDGFGFRTEYKLKQGQRGGVDDANGSKSGCSGVVPG